MPELLDISRKKKKGQSMDEWTPCAYEPTESEADWSLQYRDKKESGRRPSQWIRDIDHSDSRQDLPSEDDDLEHEFNLLADQWESETRNISSPKMITKHPAIQGIICLGEGVVPLILNRMAHHPWFWFDALMQLTRETVDPIKPSMYGDMQKMTEAWLDWGVDRGIV